MTTTEHMAAVVLRLARRLAEVRGRLEDTAESHVAAIHRFDEAEAKLRDCERELDSLRDAYNNVANLRDAEKARADKAEQTATAQWEHGRTMAEQLVVANARAAKAEALLRSEKSYSESWQSKGIELRAECDRLRGIIDKIFAGPCNARTEAIIRVALRETDAPPAAICSHAVERDIDPVLTGEWPPKPRRMKENPAMNGFGEHGIEHDEQWSCPYGNKCEPVDAEARP